MPVLEQVSDATDKLFDAAETANKKAQKVTKNLIARVEEGDLPFADRVNGIDVPFSDKLPDPQEAADAYFGFWSNGIASNRCFSKKLFNRLGQPNAKPSPKKTTAKKATAKKTTAKKA